MTQLSESLQTIQEKFKNEKIELTLIGIKNMLMFGGETVYSELTKILNIIFSHGNADFEEFTTKKIENDFSINDLKCLFKEVIILNGLEGAIPFFKDFFQTFREKFLILLDQNLTEKIPRN